MSQFWYDDETALYLAREALRIAQPEGKIALISCPTLYKTLKAEAPECDGNYQCINNSAV